MALVLLAIGGCSFVFASGPPANALPTASCTESRALPIADTVLAVGAGIGAVAGLADRQPCDPSNDCFAKNAGQAFANALGAIMLIPTAIYALSAVSGFSKTSACREFHARTALVEPTLFPQTSR